MVKKMKTERGERFDTCLMETVNKMKKQTLLNRPPNVLTLATYMILNSNCYIEMF